MIFQQMIEIFIMRLS